MVFIGRYFCSGIGLKSAVNVDPSVSSSISTFRTYIHNLGENIWQFDFCMLFTIWLLYLVEFANWDSQSTIGYGCGDNKNFYQKTGSTRNMPYHTGTIWTRTTNYGVGIQYRNIEDLWANIECFVDGCYNSESSPSRSRTIGPGTMATYIILNPADYSNAVGEKIGPEFQTNGYPSIFDVSNAVGFPLFYPTQANGSSSTYSCDNWNFNPSYAVIYVGANYSRGLDRGLFYIGNTASSGQSQSWRGARLMELP